LLGGCTFCSITEHEGRIIQSRSEESVIREIESIRDGTPGFTGVISDLGGPTANMYRLACKSREIEAACRRPSCVFPAVCPNMSTDHSQLISLYRRARSLPGVKKVLIASGVRYELAVESPEYVQELVTHHVGGYLKIAPEHTEAGPLAKMMKPGIGTYQRFKELFEKYSQAAGKKQFLIPYFISAHPGTTDQDMLNLALWLKSNKLRLDQVQNFLPTPMSTATAMYHTGKNPLRRVTRSSEPVFIPKGIKIRRLHKAFLRYHDAENWPMLREALQRMGRADLIGNGQRHLVPSWQPAGPARRRRQTAQSCSSRQDTPASSNPVTQDLKHRPPHQRSKTPVFLKNCGRRVAPETLRCGEKWPEKPHDFHRRNCAGTQCRHPGHCRYVPTPRRGRATVDLDARAGDAALEASGFDGDCRQVRRLRDFGAGRFRNHAFWRRHRPSESAGRGLGISASTRAPAAQLAGNVPPSRPALSRSAWKCARETRSRCSSTAGSVFWKPAACRVTTAAGKMPCG
jgi:hypothetical protein